MNDISLSTHLAQELIALEARYGANNYKPLDVVLTRGEGAYVWFHRDRADAEWRERKRITRWIS